MENKAKKPVIAVIAGVFVILVVVLGFIIKSNSQSTYVDQAVFYAQKLKNALKYPDTMQFTDDIKYLNYSGGECYFFYFSGRNDFGNDVLMKYVFIDGNAYDLDNYVPSEYDYTDYNGKVDREAYQIALNEAKVVVDAKTTLSLFTSGMSSDDVIIKNIPSKKVLNKLY
ncbi:MAG: hypothetical protein K2G32_01735 [Oscillospiraceae bacterium]|nr:hypothetical protein [Oscillospiraceae bacterium]